jgi:hypothetical protein
MKKFTTEAREHRDYLLCALCVSAVKLLFLFDQLELRPADGFVVTDGAA